MKKVISIFIFALAAFAFLNVTAAPIDTGQDKVPKIEKSQIEKVDLKNVETEFNYIIEPADGLANSLVKEAVSKNANSVELTLKEPFRELDSGIRSCSVINDCLYTKSNLPKAKPNYSNLHVYSWCNSLKC